MVELDVGSINGSSGSKRKHELAIGGGVAWGQQRVDTFGVTIIVGDDIPARVRGGKN